MKKAVIMFASVAALAIGTVASPAPAEARGGFGPGLAGGLIAGALISGIASNAYGYGYGPRYGYGYSPGYGYYGGGYAPVYYGSMYYEGAPVYYGPRYPRYGRVIRPAYAYYGGPRYYGGWHHHRWHRHW